MNPFLQGAKRNQYRFVPEIAVGCHQMGMHFFHVFKGFPSFLIKGINIPPGRSDENAGILRAFAYRHPIRLPPTGVRPVIGQGIHGRPVVKNNGIMLYRCQVVLPTHGQNSFGKCIQIVPGKDIRTLCQGLLNQLAAVLVKNPIASGLKCLDQGGFSSACSS